jgi:hypothetical protein
VADASLARPDDSVHAMVFPPVAEEKSNLFRTDRGDTV